MKRALMAGAAMAVLMQTPAHAEVSNAQLMEKIEAMEAEIQQLKQRVRRAESKAITADAKASEVKVSMSPALKFETADTKTHIKMGGWGQVDVANFSNDIADHPNGSNIRRARLYISGQMDEWRFKLENDFANNASGLTDAFIEYAGFNPTVITAGQFKEPFSLETLTSDMHTSFIERAALTALSPDRKIGGAVSTNDELFGGWYTASAGFFGSGTGTASSDDEQTDITGRITFAPLAEPGEVIHIGVAGSHRTPDSATDSYRVQAKAENSIMSLQAVDTGAITNVENVDQLGLEFATVWGPFAAQAEYVTAKVNRETGFGDATFEGWYAEASYFLTGESRTYVKEQARFDRTAPLDPFSLTSDGIGAWAVMARASNLDLTDGPITGGELMDYTLGVKWIPRSNIMLSANYIMAHTDAFATTPNDDPDIFLMRAQFDF